jgi:diketogulonate reductase-like aldo/keto reductase
VLLASIVTSIHCTAVNQIEIHPFLSWDEVVAYCEQEGIPIMAYSPLAKASRMKNAILVNIAKK